MSRKRNVQVLVRFDRKEYEDLMKKVHKIGGNLNQVAAKAHTLNVLDVQTYDNAVCEFKDVVRAFSREAHGVDKAMPDGNN